MKLKLLLLTPLLFLSACATQLKVSDLTPESQASYQRILAADTNTAGFREIDEVEGYFCFRNGAKVTKKNKAEIRASIMKSAQDNLRLRAAILNADAVSEENCIWKGVDWGKNCWASVTCTGKALKSNRAKSNLQKRTSTNLSWYVSRCSTL